MVDCGIFVFLEDQLFESLRSSDIMVPLKIPTPTHAPDQGGPVACLGGPVAWHRLVFPKYVCFAAIVFLARDMFEKFRPTRISEFKDVFQEYLF